MKVSVLGPSGTYSSEAAHKRFKEAKLVYCGMLSEVVDNVARGITDYGVLPIENSTNGVVDPALRCLLTHPKLKNIHILGDIKVPIRHQLYTTATSLDSLEVVYSHPQVWGQTKQWLKYHLPNAKLVDCDSTSQAVDLALAGSVREAAIGGPNSSTATPLIENCCDNQQNTTRFLVLKHSTKKLRPTGAKRVYICAFDTTIGEVCASIGLYGLIKFIDAVPSSTDWRYTVYAEAEVYDGLYMKPNWTLMGVQKARANF